MKTKEHDPGISCLESDLVNYFGKKEILTKTKERISLKGIDLKEHEIALIAHSFLDEAMKHHQEDTVMIALNKDDDDVQLLLLDEQNVDKFINGQPFVSDYVVCIELPETKDDSSIPK